MLRTIPYSNCSPCIEGLSLMYQKKCKIVTLPATGERSTGEEDVAAAMKTHTQPLPPGSTAPASLNPAEVVAMDTLLSRQLVEGLISLLINVPVS